MYSQSIPPNPDYDEDDEEEDDDDEDDDDDDDEEEEDDEDMEEEDENVLDDNKLGTSTIEIPKGPTFVIPLSDHQTSAPVVEVGSSSFLFQIPVNPTVDIPTYQ